MGVLLVRPAPRLHYSRTPTARAIPVFGKDLTTFTSPQQPKGLQPKPSILLKKRDLLPPLSSLWELGWGVGLALD